MFKLFCSYCTCAQAGDYRAELNGEGICWSSRFFSQAIGELLYHAQNYIDRCVLEMRCQCAAARWCCYPLAGSGVIKPYYSSMQSFYCMEIELLACNIFNGLYVSKLAPEMAF